MSAAQTYVCPGCREVFHKITAPPQGDDIVAMPCPAPECKRPVWVAGQPFRLMTTEVPDLSAGRYVIDQRRVLDHGQELLAMLSGAPETLTGLCEALNTEQPADHEIAGFVRAFIQQTGGTFAPGPGLIRSGELARRREKETAND